MLHFIKINNNLMQLLPICTVFNVIIKSNHFLNHGMSKIFENMKVILFYKKKKNTIYLEEIFIFNNQMIYIKVAFKKPQS